MENWLCHNLATIPWTRNQNDPGLEIVSPPKEDFRVGYQLHSLFPPNNTVDSDLNFLFFFFFFFFYPSKCFFHRNSHFESRISYIVVLGRNLRIKWGNLVQKASSWKMTILKLNLIVFEVCWRWGSFLQLLACVLRSVLFIFCLHFCQKPRYILTFE